MRNRTGVLLLLLAAGCSETAPIPMEPQFAAGPPGGFRLVMVRADAPAQPGNGGAPLVRTLAEAVSRVAPGGTISVWPGEYALESVAIDRPVTIEAAQAEKPVLRTVTDLQGFLIQEQVEGLVTFRNLEFHNEWLGTRGFSYSIRGARLVGSVRVEDSDFIMATGGHASGVGVLAAGGAGPHVKVTVLRSSFTGGRAAIAATSYPAVEIRDSRFVGQRAAVPGVSNFATQLGNQNTVLANNVFDDCGDRCVNVSGTAEVTGNRFTRCGAAYCLQAGGGGNSTVRIANNEFSNVVAPPYDPWYHHGILVYSTTATVVDNVIDGCGAGQCVLAIRQAKGRIERNTITAHGGQGTRIGIALSDGSGGNSGDPSYATDFVVADNDIRSAGAAGIRAYTVSGIHNEAFSTTTVLRNRIEGAEVGIVTRTGAQTQGSGNVLTNVRTGLAIWDANSRASLRGNDITDYVHAFHQGAANAGNDLTCNYWGSPGGPTSYTTSQGPAIFTPFATAPIAASGATTCN